MNDRHWITPGIHPIFIFSNGLSRVIQMCTTQGWKEMRTELREVRQGSSMRPKYKAVPTVAVLLFTVHGVGSDNF